MQVYKKADLKSYSTGELIDTIGPTQAASMTVQAYRSAMLDDNQSPAEIKLARFEEKTEIINVKNLVSGKEIV